MFGSLEVFQTANSMMRHAGDRQALVARNIANADTPGYKAEAIASFRETYRASSDFGLRATRAGHMGGDSLTGQTQVRDTPTEPSVNGNTVSLEHEMLAAVEVQREHNRAITIYKHSLDVLRMSLGRR